MLQLKDVRVDHRRRHMGMAKQFLNGPDIGPIQQMRRELCRTYGK